MNTIFLITGETKNHALTMGQWFANRVAMVYWKPEDVGSTIPEMPVAVVAVEGHQGVIPMLRNEAKTKADIVHIHAGSEEAARKAQGSKRHYHLETGKRFDGKDVETLMRLEAIWRAEKSLGKKTNDRDPIRIPT